MSEFIVTSAGGPYAVEVGFGNAAAAFDTARAVVIDERVGRLRNMTGRADWIPFLATEANKTLAGCQEVLVAMHAHELKRGDSLLAVGGGVVQDVATLAASIYMRGIPWVYAPTTAMAMLDSCVGGKSSINVSGIKNLVGNIYPPVHVVVDLDFAQSLPIDARVAGLSEAVKICFASGPSAFEKFLSFDIGPGDFGSTSTSDGSVDLVTHVLTSKKWFVEIDEYDQKERQLLNFGHTFGHALESATGFAIPHGVAVAFGMLAALAHPRTCRTSRSHDLSTYLIDLLRSVPESVDATRRAVDWSTYSSAILSDKKGTRDAMRLVLPAGDAMLGFIEVSRSESSVDELITCAQVALSMDLP